MIKVAVMGGVVEIADILNDYDTTGGEIRYASINHEIKVKAGILRKLLKAIRFIRDIRHYDVLLMTYIGRPDYIYALLAKAFGVPAIAQWVGCDVRKMLSCRKKYRGLGFFASHLARSRMLQEELASKNVSAKILWGAPYNISFTVAKMPEKHAVYTYLPKNREDFYGYGIIKQVAERYPDVQFYISANDNKELFPQQNVKMLGWISKEETEAMYDKISIIIRCPQHDGWSVIVMEGLFKGKEIIYNFNEGPFIRKATTVDEVCREMDDILSTPPTPRRDAHEYAMENFTPQIYSTKMAQEVRRLINERV